MSPQAGRAIEMLGHAIDYLADELALDWIAPQGRASQGRIAQGQGRDARIAAIHLLMARNREIYLGCPQIPTLTDRLRGWMQLRGGGGGRSEMVV
jgi:hypothetical protein